MNDTEPVSPMRPAGLGEGGAHIGRGAVAVVGQRLDDQRDAARAVAFVADLFVVLGVAADALLMARWMLSFGIDSALAFWIGKPQARIHRRVGHAAAWRRR